MIIPFSYMSAFLISGYKPLYNHYFDENLVFTFENYVKCSLHLNIIPDIYKRDIRPYWGALKFLGGDQSHKADCGKVLKYFYQDTSDMICGVLKDKPDLSISISILVDIKVDCDFPVIAADLSKVESELSDILNSESSTNPLGFGASIFTKFDLAQLNSLVVNRSLALASVLNFYASEEIEPTILEVS